MQQRPTELNTHLRDNDDEKLKQVMNRLNTKQTNVKPRENDIRKHVNEKQIENNSKCKKTMVSKGKGIAKRAKRNVTTFEIDSDDESTKSERNSHMITRICMETSMKRAIFVILRREVNCLEQSVPTVKLSSLILKRKSAIWLETRD